MNTKLKRGRPRGTGKNDQPTLEAMAELMAEKPMRPTAAIRRILRNPSEADIRRLQVKWKQMGAKLLTDAVARRDARRASEAARRSGRVLERVRQDQDKIADLVAMVVGGNASAAAVARLAREAHESPALRAMRDLHDSPAMRAARELHDSPAMRAARELQDSPAMRAARELQDSPAMRAARELHDSPAMRAARELQESAVMRLLGGRR